MEIIMLMATSIKFSSCSKNYHFLTRENILTLLFSLMALSNDAPVYIEQKSNSPSNTGLKRNHNFYNYRASSSTLGQKKKENRKYFA